MKKKVLLTGFTGFVGQNFVKHHSQEFEITKLDLRTHWQNQSFAGHDAVIHCAALVHQMSGAPEAEYFKVNTELTKDLALKAKAEGVKHFVFLSTSHVFGVYGDLRDHNFKLKEDSPCHPTDPYGRSKLAAELALKTLDSDKFKVSIVRSPMVYGPGAKGNILNLHKLVKLVPILPFGFSENRRSMIYVGNLCYFLSLVVRTQTSGILLAQDEKAVSIEELVLTLAKVSGTNARLFRLPDFIFNFLCRVKPNIMTRLFGTLALDSTSSNSRLGYVPPFSMLDGFRGMFSKKSIQIFSYGFYPENFIINELATEFVQKNFSVSVLTGLPNYPKGEFFKGYSFLGPYSENYNGASVIRHPVTPRKSGLIFLALNYFSNLLFASLSIFRLPKKDIAFVFAVSPLTIAIPAILWAKLRSAKVIIWLQDLWPESITAVTGFSDQSLVVKLIEPLMRWIYKNTDLMLIQSEGFKSNLEKYGYKGKTVLIPNWANDLSVASGTEPDWLKDFPSGFTVTFAGNIGKAQGIDTVLQAALKLKDHKKIHFVFVGDGSAKRDAEIFVKTHSLTNVFFMGRHPPEDMPFLFKRSSCLLVSLKRDPHLENVIPAKTQSYMSAGKPTIGSLDGQGRLVIEAAKCGFVSSCDDAEGLANNVLRMSQLSEKELSDLGQNAKRYFEGNFKRELVVGRVEEVLMGQIVKN